MQRLKTRSGGAIAAAGLALVMPAAAAAGNPPTFTPSAPQSASAGGSTGSSAKGDHWYIAKGSSCIVGTARPGTYAKVSFLMHAGPHGATKVTNFLLHARMIPAGQNVPGQNAFRSWSTNPSASLIGRSSANSLLMTTWAQVPGTEKDWDLQVKLQWKRDLARDWNTTLAVHFDEAGRPAAEPPPRPATETAEPRRAAGSPLDRGYHRRPWR